MVACIRFGITLVMTHRVPFVNNGGLIVLIIIRGTPGFTFIWWCGKVPMVLHRRSKLNYIYKITGTANSNI